MKLITSSGGTIDVLYMTRGELGQENNRGAPRTAQEDLARRRSDEAVEACRILGVRKVEFLAGRDSHLEQEPDLWRGVWQVLQSDNYRSVFCPWHGDQHNDHMATFQLLLAALRYHAEDIDVWMYEVWTPLESNLAIPIDATIHTKLEAIRAHRSQRVWGDFPRAFRALAQYRSLLCPMSKYAEAFLTVDRQQLIAAADAGRIPRVMGEGRSSWTDVG